LKFEVLNLTHSKITSSKISSVVPRETLIISLKMK
jgi:hypothetical protein